MKSSKLTVFLYVCVLSSGANAVPVTIEFSGVRLGDIGEYISAVPVPSDMREFAPLMEAARTISGSIEFDTSQPDVDPSPGTGTYRIGTLSVQIPELGLAASRSSTTMQISSFDNTSSLNDQFFAYVDGVDSFVSGVGLPNPVSFSAELFGSTSMLPDDQLPTGPLDWTRGDVSFDFSASDGTKRQVLIRYVPAPVPEPISIMLLGAGGVTAITLLPRRADPVLHHR